MNRHVIVPPTGLLPHRPYSPAIQVDRLLFVSGHTGSDPVTRAFSTTSPSRPSWPSATSSP